MQLLPEGILRITNTSQKECHLSHKTPAIRERPTNATVKRRCLLKRKAQTDVTAPNPAPKN